MASYASAAGPSGEVLSGNTYHPDRGVQPFVDGRLVKSDSAAEYRSINPSTGRELHSFGEGCERDVNMAVNSARVAFNDARWTSKSPLERKSVLLRLADLTDSHAPSLDFLDAEEMGKPIAVKPFNASSAAAHLRFIAEASDKLNGEVASSSVGAFFCQRLVPRGVVAAVTPWNFPTYNALLKIAPALAAGNTVVLKPSELASRSALRLAHLAMEAGLPPGAFNVVPGIGPIVGKALARHHAVDMLAFTGSSETGKAMLGHIAHSSMKPILAECGGKSPHIIFDDCNTVQKTARSIAEAILVNQGQICSVGSRVLVHRSISDAVVEEVRCTFEAVRMGAATSEKTSYGPMASLGHLQRVASIVKQGACSSKLVCGGDTSSSSEGYYIKPALFRNVKPCDPLAQLEIFGPVLSIVEFDKEEEAIEVANSTAYGLVSYVWTSDINRALRVTDRIRSGVVVNASLPVGNGPGHAFSLEPAGDSGLGVEGGIPGLQSYLRRQMIWINYG